MQRGYDVHDGRLISSPDHAEITIIHADISSSYRGTSFAHMEFACSEDMLRYQSIAHVSYVHNRDSLLPQSIKSQKEMHSVNISTPFAELESVGNEIALYMLLEHKILTMDAVACVYQNVLVLFLGKSNSGKTTSARLLKLRFPEIRIVSDDFVCFRNHDSNCEFSVPVWDILSDCSCQNPWQTIDSIILVDLNKDYKVNSLYDLFNYTIGSNFSPEIALHVYTNLQSFVGLGINTTVLHAKHQDFYSVSDKVVFLLSNYSSNTTEGTT